MLNEPPTPLDHSKATKDLLKAGIDVYSSKETFGALSIKSYCAIPVKPLKQFKVGSFTILPFPLQHDVYNLGYLIANKEGKRVIFVTDTYYCQYKFPKVTCILVECNYSNRILERNIENGLNPAIVDRLLTSHFELENVKEFIKANDNPNLKNIVLLHLSDGNSNAKEFKEQIHELTNKAVYVADKGLEIELNKEAPNDKL